ncbi:MAG TPA: hypothetical protein VNM66_00380, partial [Thermodesulfobacteriota bacterium]|nr:hypothetical protein [Thermodesulfobacteriota bacterium]
GLAASGLAARDDYATAAAGYAAGSAAGLALILWRVEPDGILAVAWGMTLNAGVSLAVPLAGLALRSLRERMPLGAARPSGTPPLARLRLFAGAAVLTLCLQALYVACLPFAARLGAGDVTSFAYAYLGASAVVAVTTSSIGLVSAVPLARAGMGAEAAARHVVASAWIALTVVGGTAAAFALAGGSAVPAVLGGAYGDEVGSEIGRLVVALSPWMVASVGVTAAFPLVFVAGRSRLLAPLGIGALVLHVPAAWLAWAGLGLTGLALALALSTLLLLAALLRALGALGPALRGLAAAAATLAALTVAAFAPAALVLPEDTAVLVGGIAYAALVAALRPRGLRAAWGYLRALG